jgi:hypothetical protein
VERKSKTVFKPEEHLVILYPGNIKRKLNS